MSAPVMRVELGAGRVTARRVGAAGSLARAAGLVVWLAGCGGGGGPALEALPQSIAFGTAPSLTLAGGATVSARASSGLPVTYSSATPQVCGVDGSTGRVSAAAAGTCVVAADQPGDDRYAPAPRATQSLAVIVDPEQVIRFAAAPSLALYGTALVSAGASSGLPVTYASRTPQVCTVDARTGLVTSIATGACVLTADQPGDSTYHAAPQAMLTLTVETPGANADVPGVPGAVSATLGSTPSTVVVSFTAPASAGGAPVTGFAVASIPAGASADGTSSPIVVTCPGGCAGFAFNVSARNRFGAGAASAAADVLTQYTVTATFLEPMTQPKNSIFVGSFSVNSTNGKVSGLTGRLSESMTGGLRAYPNDDMTWLTLSYPLDARYDATLGGWLVTTFLQPDTRTFTTDPRFGGTDGWAPGSGMGLYSGFPGTNPGNAYVRIFVNAADPLAPLTPAQIDKLAYADCAPGGMMGATCMTGTTVAGYGTLGSMSGFPAAQVVTRR